MCQVNPLNGARRIDRADNGIDKYFIKIVPTEYHSLYGEGKLSHYLVHEMIELRVEHQFQPS